MTVQNFFQETLDELVEHSAQKRLRLLQGAQGPRVIIEGQKVLNFCSNNYLGLANDKRLVEASMASLKTEGVGSGASRLVCGHMRGHQKLENKIAAFKGKEQCLLFSTGYMANGGIISSVFGRGDMIFSDRLNHASIVDGILLSQANFKRYPHRDMGALENLLKSSEGYKKRGIITDSVFSMDGDVAPLKEIVALAKKYDCLVMIDEAHAFGIMGKTGRGLAEHLNVEDKIDIHMGTLSKAAGSFGAYCCGSAQLISFLINKARSFIYTTGMPPSVAAASLKAIEIIENDVSLRERLWQNTHYMRKKIREMGFDTMNSETPIIPLLIKDSQMTVEFSKRLFDLGIYIAAIRPPTVPQGTARLRLTVMASHTKEDLDQTLESLQKIGESLCLI